MQRAIACTYCQGSDGYQGRLSDDSSDVRLMGGSFSGSLVWVGRVSARPMLPSAQDYPGSQNFHSQHKVAMISGGPQIAVLRCLLECDAALWWFDEVLLGVSP